MSANLNTANILASLKLHGHQTAEQLADRCDMPMDSVRESLRELYDINLTKPDGSFIRGSDGNRQQFWGLYD